MTHQVNSFQFFPLSIDELSRIFEDDVVQFNYFKNEYLNQSTLDDKYDQVNDAFRLAQIVLACEFYNLLDMNKKFALVQSPQLIRCYLLLVVSHDIWNNF